MDRNVLQRRFDELTVEAETIEKTKQRQGDGSYSFHTVDRNQLLAWKVKVRN